MVEGHARLTCERSGLTPAQAEMLAILAASGAAVPLHTLADAMGLRAARISELVVLLEMKGFVSKRRLSEGRNISVDLTSDGDQRASMIAGWSATLVQAVETLPSDEQMMLLQSLDSIVAALRDMISGMADG
jgi:DNA-binding MarR family transcriptional regulator